MTEDLRLGGDEKMDDAVNELLRMTRGADGSGNAGNLQQGSKAELAPMLSLFARRWIVASFELPEPGKMTETIAC